MKMTDDNKNQNINEKYKSIIDLPYRKSIKRPHMSITDRAAQFGSFAALTGHKEAVLETARLTENKIVLDECQVSKINNCLKLIEQSLHLNKKPISTGTTDKLMSGELPFDEIVGFDEDENYFVEKMKKADHHIKVIYFVPDKYKSGGSYAEAMGRPKKLDNYKRLLYMDDGSIIPIEDIVEIEL